MKWFSHRKGLKKVRTTVQVDSLDKAARNRLWNMLDIYWGVMRGYTWLDDVKPMEILFKKMWHNYFKLPLDHMPAKCDPLYDVIRKHFFECDWFEVYDFLEFIVNNFPLKEVNDKFTTACNNVLEQDLCAYRFVGGKITQITSEEEITEIEEALETPLKPVKTHLGNSLKLLSDRKTPDYRNSIKESISAVEAICRLVANDQNASLGQALNRIEDKIGLHGALKSGFSSLYGYTSSADGIRHALLEESNLSFEDAKFMLVSCSAFINYLVSKAGKAGLKL